jgi:hypothetical protein
MADSVVADFAAVAPTVIVAVAATVGIACPASRWIAAGGGFQGAAAIGVGRATVAVIGDGGCFGRSTVAVMVAAAMGGVRKRCVLQFLQKNCSGMGISS